MPPVGGEEEGKWEWDLLPTCLQHPILHLAAQQEQLQELKSSGVLSSEAICASLILQ